MSAINHNFYYIEYIVALLYYFIIKNEVWEYFCETFKLDTPIKESLATKVMSLDSFLSKVPKEKIAWCLEQIKDRESFCGNELDEVTELLIDIGKL